METEILLKRDPQREENRKQEILLNAHTDPPVGSALVLG